MAVDLSALNALKGPQTATEAQTQKTPQRERTGPNASQMAAQTLTERENRKRADYVNKEAQEERRRALLDAAFSQIQQARADAEAIQSALLLGIKEGKPTEEMLMLALSCIDKLTASGGVMAANAEKYMMNRK